VRLSAELRTERLLLPDEPRLYSFTTPGNHRSQNVMKRLGLTERGRALWHGYDTVWYALDRA
jgi:RimJ/RimL family protein N-acetyltransferase